MVDTPQSANPNSPDDADDESDGSGEAAEADGPASDPRPQSHPPGAGDEAFGTDGGEPGSFGGDPFGEESFEGESFEGPSFEEAMAQAAAEGASSRGGAGRPGGFGGDAGPSGGGAGFAVEMAKMWIRDHQKTVLLGAFATGVFLGALLRD